MLDGIQNRLKAIRKKSKKTQEEFSSMFGVSRTAYSKYESGLVVPNDTFLQLVCSKLNVSETWLRTGQGDMYVQTDDKIVAQLVEKYNMTDEQRQVMEIFLDMPEEKRQLVAKAFFALLDTANAHKQPVLSPVSDADAEEETKELEAYRQEYRAVKRGVFPSVSGNDGTHGGGTK